MIVDDSQIARAVLSRMISSHADFEVAVTAGNAADALSALRMVSVDIVLLDVEMPGTSGLDALPDILKVGAGAQVLIVSSTTGEGAETAVRALALGAADTLPKPGTGAFAGQFSNILVERLRQIARPAHRPPALRPTTAPSEGPAITLRAMSDHPLRCLALGASTGGLHALSEFLRSLPPEIGAPILITQHLPPVFMPFFARQIEAASGRPARVAEDGMTLQPERILIAPGDRHLSLSRDGDSVIVRLLDHPVSSGCRPSVDPMFSAVADIYGPAGLAAVFTGMGRDGLVGSAHLVESGGSVIAQDEESSAVWGMPRAVAEAGLVSAMLPPAELAARVSACAAGDRS